MEIQPQPQTEIKSTENLKNNAGKGSGMKYILPLLLAALVFLSSCTAVQQKAAEPKTAGQPTQTTTTGTASVDKLGTQANDVTAVETDLGLNDLNGVESVLTDIEKS